MKRIGDKLIYVHLVTGNTSKWN